MKKGFALLGLIACSATGLLADIFYITARPSPTGAGANLDGTYVEVGLDGVMSDTSVKSSAIGVKPSSGSRYYLSSNSLSGPTKGVDIFPTLTNLTGVYQIDYTQNPSAANVTEDAIFSVSAVGGTLNFSNTTVFQRGAGTNVWTTIGRITLNGSTNTPKISFRYQSGDINDAPGVGHRWILDCWRFTLVEPCLSVVTPGVTGPVAAGATNPVIVTGVSAGASEISVYQNSGKGMVKIGSRISGIVAGDNVVTATNLVKGAQIAATQTIGGQESCVPTSGILVGGANPRVRLALSTRYNPALAGPIGADGGSQTSCLWHLGATNLTGTAPGDAKVVLQPSTNWQTVTWWRDHPTTPDAAVIYNDSGCGGSLSGNFGILEGLSIAMDDLTDTGPMTLYIDNVENGGTMIQDFESVASGQNEISFRRPRFVQATAGNILLTPNDSQVTNQFAFAGTNSLRVSFQFNGLGSNRWVRLTTSGAPNKPNPQIDLRQPITMKILLLPSPATLGAPAISYSLTGSNLTLNWSGNYNLQFKTNLSSANWSNVGVSSGPYNTSVTNATRFFRLQSP